MCLSLAFYSHVHKPNSKANDKTSAEISNSVVNPLFKTLKANCMVPEGWLTTISWIIGAHNNEFHLIKNLFRNFSTDVFTILD